MAKTVLFEDLFTPASRSRTRSRSVSRTKSRRRSGRKSVRASVSHRRYSSPIKAKAVKAAFVDNVDYDELTKAYGSVDRALNSKERAYGSPRR